MRKFKEIREWMLEKNQISGVECKEFWGRNNGLEKLGF